MSNNNCERHLEGSKHNCAYVDWRDSFVPVAEAVADAKHGTEAPEGSSRLEAAGWAAKWDATFHREMRRLTADPFVRARDGQDAFAAVPEQFRDPLEELEAVAGMSSAAKGVSS